jgi:hypothetical protein
MMIRKQLIGAASALCLLLSSGLLQSNLAAAQETGAGKSCRDNPSGGNAGQDTCVLSRNGSTESAGESAVWLCKMLDGSGALEILGWSQGECVRAFAKLAL